MKYSGIAYNRLNLSLMFSRNCSLVYMHHDFLCDVMYIKCIVSCYVCCGKTKAIQQGLVARGGFVVGDFVCSLESPDGYSFVCTPEAGLVAFCL